MAVLIPDIVSYYNTKQAINTDSNKDSGKVGYSYCLHVVSRDVVVLSWDIGGLLLLQT